MAQNRKTQTEKRENRTAKPPKKKTQDNHQTKTGNQCYCGITALAAFVDHLDGVKNVVGSGLKLAQAMQLVGKHIEQHLGVRICIEVAKI